MTCELRKDDGLPFHSPDICRLYPSVDPRDSPTTTVSTISSSSSPCQKFSRASISVGLNFDNPATQSVCIQPLVSSATISNSEKCCEKNIVDMLPFESPNSTQSCNVKLYSPTTTVSAAASPSSCRSPPEVRKVREEEMNNSDAVSITSSQNMDSSKESHYSSWSILGDFQKREELRVKKIRALQLQKREEGRKRREEAQRLREIEKLRQAELRDNSELLAEEHSIKLLHRQALAHRVETDRLCCTRDWQHLMKQNQAIEVELSESKSSESDAKVPPRSQFPRKPSPPNSSSAPAHANNARTHAHAGREGSGVTGTGGHMGLMEEPVAALFSLGGQLMSILESTVEPLGLSSSSSSSK